MKSKLLLICCMLMTCVMTGHAIKIKRYVAEGAGGDGLSKENPSGDLLKMLRLSSQVEELTLYVAPGTYHLPPLEDANIREKFRMVKLIGGWSMSDDKQTDEKAVITGDLFINGGLVWGIDFRGSKRGNAVEGYLTGAFTALGCNVYESIISNLEMMVAGETTTYLRGVSAACTSISPQRTGMRGAVVNVDNCQFSNGLGLSANGVVLRLRNCVFSENNQTALTLYGCEGTTVERCKFRNNKSGGAVGINCLTDDYSTYFSQCSFTGNTSGNADMTSAISSNAPVYMKDCLIAGNSSELVAAGKRTPGKHWGALELNRHQSFFVNCTFYGNKDAAVYYNMTQADHQKVNKGQFFNCVFLYNRLSAVCPNGNGPLLYHSAADFGSEIPELDADKQLLRIDRNTAKITYSGDDFIFLNEGSPLINAGLNVIDNDLFNFNHQLLGGTDLGCTEYMGTWKKTEPEKVVTIGEHKFVQAESSYNDKKYYMLVPAEDVKEDGSAILLNGLYTGDLLAPVKVLDDTHVIVYMTYGGKKKAVLTRNSELYDFGPKAWKVIDGQDYTNVLPTATKDSNGAWKLKKNTAPAAKSPVKKAPVRRK